MISTIFIVIIASALMLVASLVAIGNLVGPLRATPEHGFSFMPFLSIFFCALAYCYGRTVIGLWAFIPAALDLANWAMVLALCYYSTQWIKARMRSWGR
jgi:hypothetical protein